MQSAEVAESTQPGARPRHGEADQQVIALLTSLSDQLKETNSISRERESIIDRLHEENQRLKLGELQQATLPVFRDLIRLYDDLKLTAADYAAQETTGGEKFVKDLSCYSETVADILYRHGVERSGRARLRPRRRHVRHHGHHDEGRERRCRGDGRRPLPRRADWDKQLTEYFAEEFNKLHPGVSSPLDSPHSYRELLKKSEEAKVSLTSKDKYRLSMSHEGERAMIELSREEFEQLTSDLLERTVVMTKEVIEEAKGKGFHNIDQIILVGGSSKMPYVARRLKEEFGLEAKLFEPDFGKRLGALGGRDRRARGLGSAVGERPRLHYRLGLAVPRPRVEKPRRK